MRRSAGLLIIFVFLLLAFSRAHAAITWSTDYFDYKAADQGGIYYNSDGGVPTLLSASSDKAQTSGYSENAAVAAVTESQTGLSMASGAWGASFQNSAQDSGGASVYGYATNSCALDTPLGVCLNGQNVTSFIDRPFTVTSTGSYTVSASAVEPLDWSGTTTGTATVGQPLFTGVVQIFQTDSNNNTTTMLDSTTFGIASLAASSQQATLNLVAGDSYQLVVALSGVSSLGSESGQPGIKTSFSNLDQQTFAWLGSIDGNFNAGAPSSPVTITASLSPAKSISLNSDILLWTGNGSANVWKLDSSDNYVSSIAFGPYSGWTPTSYVFAPDGTARLLWSNTNGAVIVWTLDSSGSYVSSIAFGPYSGWTPTSYVFAPDGSARLMWSNTNGAAIIWTLDSSNNYVGSVGFGPYSGWTPARYVLAPDGTARLLWSNTNGAAIVWKLDSSNNYVSSAGFGPYTGWAPVNYVFASDGTVRLLWANTNGSAIVWKLDSSGNYVGSVGFGPYTGWMPIEYGFAADGAPRVLWANSGAAIVWKLDGSDSYVSSVGFGPYSSWTPLSYN